VIKLYRAWLFIASVVLLCMGVFIFVLLINRTPEQERLVNALLIVSVIVLGICLVAVVHFSSKMIAEPLLPERFRINERDPESFLVSVQNKLLADEYEFAGKLPSDFGGDVVLYTKREFWGMDCYMLLRVGDYTDEIEALYGTLFWDYFCAAFPEWVSLDVSLTSLVCVDALTPAFETRLGKNLEQAPGRYHLPAGACFSDMTVYIPAQKSGRYRSQYRRLRRTLLQYL